MKQSVRFTTSFVFAVISTVVCSAEITDEHAMQVANEALSKLSLEEKIKLTHGSGTMTIGANAKIGLTEEFYMSDSSHTVRHDMARMAWDKVGDDNEATVMPALQGLAQTWDVDLAEEFGHLIGQEARDRGKDMMLGPGINIHRTPICGRNWEYMSEDPHLTAALTVPYIQSLQANGVAATVKHFAVNNQELNRNWVDTVVDERTLREIYLPGFRAAVVDAGALAVMSGYNRFRGEHCSHSDYLNNQVLKDEWGFKGFVVTDWGGLHNAKAGALGGTDVEMHNGRHIKYFKDELPDLVKSGEVSEAVIDDKARRVLYVMAKIGKIGSAEPRVLGARNTAEHQALARTVAEDALVLLKNENHVLPLNPDGLKHVLLIGNADEEHCGGGCSAIGTPPYEITAYEGIQQFLGDDVIVETIRFPSSGEDLTQIPAHCITTEDPNNKESFAVTGWRMEFFNNKDLEGEALSGFAREINYKHLNGFKVPEGINPKAFSLRLTAEVVPKASGVYLLKTMSDDGVRIRVDGKEVINDWSNHQPRLKDASIELVAGERYAFVVEYFQGGGGGSLVFGWDAPGSEAMNTLVEKTKAADAVLIFTGTTHGGRIEAREEEMFDRTQYELPADQMRTVEAVLGLNPKTVVVNHSGTAVDLSWAKAKAPAIIQEPYNGQEAGNALANVLFGKVNPSGRLTYTIGSQLNDYGAHALDTYNSQYVVYEEGIFVGYRWFDEKAIEPVYPFGSGLSYTTFSYADPVLSKNIITDAEDVTASVTVTNTGQTVGAEVVQVYVSDETSSLPRPERELKGFVKVKLNPGESKTVSITLNRNAFAFYHPEKGGWVVEPGHFTVHFAHDSRDIRCSAQLILK
ncbi:MULTISPECIES: glycoside hydrolase family 3 C-terminal domain-containing protein [unclassified Lentimonas]|uniref:glycoside hydrolase family 3 C-terminal domain-containing protein n=1 Tax=unclassified Lentimonas TaxID=2630993 RepID=UPI001320FB26|nr:MULTISPECIES: glycoside hydrolase family 3 C-terminal domain-containing protein [unclassified Lentimonas]CAA6693105.1 Beta-glucosidase (EC [Lentimonas sp. CC19]CAA6695640.1 Beta-glucosidase (EC [Lentimonas sp. CC10]CAA7071511.1 Beta-glucosidase (EC [Lentimonas sp. CC11]